MNRRQAIISLTNAAGWFNSGASLGADYNYVNCFDPTGKQDCSAWISQKLKPGGSLHLKAGVYRITSGSIDLPDRFTLTGELGAILESSLPPNIPLICINKSRDVSIQALELVNKYITEKCIVLESGQHAFELILPLPWRYPSIHLTHHLVDRGAIYLQYGSDYRAKINKNGVWQITLAKKITAKEPSLIICTLRPGFSSLIGAYEAENLSIQGITCKNGSVSYYFDAPTVSNLSIKNCTINNGQIRVWSSENTIYPFSDHSVNLDQAVGASNISIESNIIIGDKEEGACRYKLSLTDRLHGILISGAATNVNIANNYVANCAGDGIYMQSSLKSTVSGNIAVFNKLSGIGIENGTVRPSSGLKIINNISMHNWFDGCDYNNCNPAKLPAFKLSSKNRGYESKNIIKNNLFSFNGSRIDGIAVGCGIYIRWASGAQISQNVCTGNQLSGIYANISSSILLYGNVSSDNAQSKLKESVAACGIFMRGCINFELIENTDGPSVQQNVLILKTNWVGPSLDGLVTVESY